MSRNLVTDLAVSLSQLPLTFPQLIHALAERRNKDSFQIQISLVGKMLFQRSTNAHTLHDASSLIKPGISVLCCKVKPRLALDCRYRMLLNIQNTLQRKKGKQRKLKSP